MLKYYLHSRTQNTFIIWGTIYPRGSRSRCASVICPRSDAIFELYQWFTLSSVTFMCWYVCRRHSTSLDVVITSLTNDVSHVDRWCQHNRMFIKSDKSNVMFISSRQDRQILQSNTEIPYHDSVIKSCSTAKLRGVTCTVCHGMITLKLL